MTLCYVIQFLLIKCRQLNRCHHIITNLFNRHSRGRVGNLSSMSSMGSMGSMTGPKSHLETENLLEYNFKSPQDIPQNENRNQIQGGGGESDREGSVDEDRCRDRGRSRDGSKDTERDEKTVKEKRTRRPETEAVFDTDPTSSSKSNKNKNLNSNRKISVLDNVSQLPYKEPSNSIESKEHSAEINKLLSGGIENYDKAANVKNSNKFNKSDDNHNHRDNSTTNYVGYSITEENVLQDKMGHSKSQRNVLQDREDRLESRAKRIDLVRKFLVLEIRIRISVEIGVDQVTLMHVTSIYFT